MDTQHSNLPPVADRLSLDYEDLRAEITDALKATDSLVEIASDADVLIARELVAPLKALQNRCVAAHKAEKQPYLDGGRAVDGFFKALRVHLDSVVALITEEASQYQTRKLALAREKAASEARIAAMLEEPAPAAPAPAAMTRVSDNGSVAVSGAVRWDYEITDEAALPRELLQPNVAAIRARIAGLKATTTIDKAAGAIPGLRIAEKISTTFR
jgi:hypothetical protein